jgi:hypothetical protein
VILNADDWLAFAKIRADAGVISWRRYVESGCETIEKIEMAALMLVDKSTQLIFINWSITKTCLFF